MKNNFLILIFFSLLGFGIYSSALHGGFVWDDEYLVEHNLLIRDLNHVGTIFSTDFGTGGGKEYGFYRPLQILSYALMFHFFKDNVFYYHLISIICHILIAFMLFHLVLQLYKEGAIAFVAGLLWLCHPVHCEAVAYISGLGDPLALLFFLISMFCYIRLTENGFNFLELTIMILAYGLAIFSKEISIMLPLFLFLYHLAFHQKIKAHFLLSLFCVWVFYLGFRLIFAQHALVISPLQGLGERIPGCFAAFINYFNLLVFPVDLHMEYAAPANGFNDLSVVLGIIFMGALSLTMLKNRNDSRIFFPMGWIFLGFLPISNLYPLPFYMADHYLYLPSIGFFMLCALGFFKLWQFQKYRPLIIVILILIVGILSYRSFRQNDYWKDNITFNERTLQYSPQSVEFQNNLGRLYAQQERYEDALAHFNEVMLSHPDYPYTYNNIGQILNNEHRYRLAIPYFTKALELKPDYPDALNNIGVAYKRTGRLNDAINAYQKAILLRPDFAGAYGNLGNALCQSRRMNEAMIAFGAAIKIDPSNPTFYFNKTYCYQRFMENNEAFENIKKAKEIDLKNF